MSKGAIAVAEDRKIFSPKLKTEAWSKRPAWLPSGAGLTTIRLYDKNDKLKVVGTVWRVRLGSRLLGPDRKPEFKNFSTLKEAKDYVRAMSKKTVTAAIQGGGLQGSDLADAVQALGLLRAAESSLTLVNAVQIALRHSAPADGKPWKEALDLFEADNSDRSPLTRKGYRQSVRAFFSACAFKKVSDVTPDSITKWVKARGVVISQKHHTRSLNRFFAWLVDENHLPHSPMPRFKWGKDVRVPKYFEPDQVAAILNAATGQMKTCLALIFFGGLRSSEVQKWEWQWLVDNEVSVPAAIAKKRKLRGIPINPTLQAFIDLVPLAERRGHVAPQPIQSKDGKVLTSEWVWRHNFEAVVRGAGFKARSADKGEEDYIRNGLRHSFGTYSYKIYGEEKTSEWMGNSPNVVHAFYKGRASEVLAKKYWAITPEAKKIPDIEAL